MRFAAVLVALAAACAVLPAGAGALAAPAQASGPTATGPLATAATHSCHVPEYPGLGYFTSLRVSGTSCRVGSKVTLAYYHCRVKHGRRGTCHSSVLGFSCRERRNSIETEIEARVTCHKGEATVVHTYQQNL